MSITARTRKQHAVRVRIPVRPHVPTSRPCSSVLTPHVCLQACVCQPRAGPGPTNAPRLICGSYVHIRGQQAPRRELVTARGLHGNPPSPAHDSKPLLGVLTFSLSSGTPVPLREGLAPNRHPHPVFLGLGVQSEQGAPHTPAVSMGEATSWPQACPGPGSLQAGHHYQDVIEAPSSRLAVLPG